MKAKNHDQLPRLSVVSQRSSPLLLAYDDFLLSRQVMRCTPKTMDHYRYSTGGFVDWLEERGITTPDAIKAAHVRARLAALGETGVKDTTLHVHARGIKTFLRFLHAEGYTTAAITFAMPRLDRKRLPYANVDEIHRLLDACRHPRDKALLLLMVDTGLRLAETAALTWGDLDVRSGLVRVQRGKGGKARSVVVGATTRRVLLAYRRWWVQKWGKEPAESEGVWRSFSTGEPLKPNGISLALRRLGKATGLNLSPHMLRRTFATLSLRAGMSPLHLQGLLGHSTLEMTRRYTQLVEDDLKDAHERFGPVDSWL